MRVIIIHGTLGSPEGNWFPWLKAELEKQGIKAITPRFPTPEGQSLQAWLAILNKYKMDEDTILVGHSIGPTVIMKKLQQLDKPIRAVILVSGWIGKIDNSEYDKLNKTFFEGEFNWERIKKNAGKIVMFYGDNDPYVSMKLARELASKLGVELRVIKNGGHLNSEAGYTKFPEVLAEIKKLL